MYLGNGRVSSGFQAEERLYQLCVEIEVSSGFTRRNKYILSVIQNWVRSGIQGEGKDLRTNYERMG